MFGRKAEVAQLEPPIASPTVAQPAVSHDRGDFGKDIAAQLPIPLPDFLVGNPYFAAGFGLAGIGFVGSLKRLTTRL